MKVGNLLRVWRLVSSSLVTPFPLFSPECRHDITSNHRPSFALPPPPPPWSTVRGQKRKPRFLVVPAFIGPFPARDTPSFPPKARRVTGWKKVVEEAARSPGAWTMSVERGLHSGMFRTGPVFWVGRREELRAVCHFFHFIFYVGGGLSRLSSGCDGDAFLELVSEGLGPRPG